LRLGLLGSQSERGKLHDRGLEALDAFGELIDGKVRATQPHKQRCFLVGPFKVLP
jgi:hypothetical protein